MKAAILVKDSKRYGGKYVAIRSVKSKEVLISGKDPSKVYDKAKDKGAKNPIIFYVPKKGMVHIF